MCFNFLLLSCSLLQTETDSIHVTKRPFISLVYEELELNDHICSPSVKCYCWKCDSANKRTNVELLLLHISSTLCDACPVICASLLTNSILCYTLYMIQYIPLFYECQCYFAMMSLKHFCCCNHFNLKCEIVSLRMFGLKH